MKQYQIDIIIAELERAKLNIIKSFDALNEVIKTNARVDDRAGDRQAISTSNNKQ